MVQDILEKIKELPREFWNDIFTVFVIMLVSLGSFGLGRLSVLYESPREHGAPLEVVQSTSDAPPRTSGVVHGVSAQDESGASPAAGTYVASKGGTKYHLPWCSGAQRIKEENKIFFATKTEAEAAGYTPASNCKGI